MLVTKKSTKQARKQITRKRATKIERAQGSESQECLQIRKHERKQGKGEKASQ